MGGSACACACAVSRGVCASTGANRPVPAAAANPWLSAGRRAGPRWAVWVPAGVCQTPGLGWRPLPRVPAGASVRAASLRGSPGLPATETPPLSAQHAFPSPQPGGHVLWLSPPLGRMVRAVRVQTPDCRRECSCAPPAEDIWRVPSLPGGTRKHSFNSFQRSKKTKAS